MAIDPSILDEIAANPTDESPQLVVADMLLEAEDPRGELIVLDRHERSGAPLDVHALERLLTLAAIYGFPDPSDAPPPALPWRIHQRAPLECEVIHAEREYTVRQDGEYLFLTIADLEGRRMEEHTYTDLFDADEPSDRDRDAVLGSIGDAIRAGTPLDRLWFPLERGGAPTFEGGARRCYAVPDAFYLLVDAGRGHFGIAARDHERWFALWTRLAAHVPGDRYPGWPGRRLVHFERRLGFAGIPITRRVSQAPSPHALSTALAAKRADGVTARFEDTFQSMARRDDFIELQRRTLGPGETVLAVGTETELAPDQPWLELAPPRGWLPRLLSTQPGHVLLLSADGTRTLLLVGRAGLLAYAYATAELLGP